MTDRTADRGIARKAAARRRTRRRRLFAGGAGLLVLCLAGGGVALAAGRDSGPAYRTATAAVGSVEQTLAASGTISSATRFDTAFSVAGTVATVPVTVGATVTAGAVLATLDTASLEAAVEDSASTLADAEQQLSDDLASQTASATSTAATSTAGTAAAGTSAASKAAATPTAAATSSATPTTGTGTTGPATGGTATEPTDAVAAAVAAVTRAQHALLAQYELTATALGVSGTSVATSQTSCEAFLAATDTPTQSPTDSPTDTPTDTPTDAPTDTPTPEPSTTAEALAACQEAIGQVLIDQKSVDTAQASLLTLATALDRAVTGVQTAVAAAAATPSTTPSTTPTATPTAGTPSGATPAAPTTSAAQAAASPTSAGGQATIVASAATILADRSAIAAAEGEVAIAKDAATRIDLTSPIAGTVAAVSLAVGDAVTASSTTAVITVIGQDGFVATTTVPLSAIDTVEVGQSATLTVPSTTTGLTGKVSSIGVLDTSSSSDPTYTVVVAVDATTEPLFNGSSAQVVVTVASKEGVLSVPSSAVHVDGSTTTVQVLDADGVAAETTVEIGAVGTELTEILSGLTEGDQVVLADLSEVLVSDTSTDSSLTSLGGSTEQSVPAGMPDFGGQMPAGGPGRTRPGS